jgi:hypothetical protein
MQRHTWGGEVTQVAGLQGGRRGGGFSEWRLLQECGVRRKVLGEVWVEGWHVFGPGFAAWPGHIALHCIACLSPSALLSQCSIPTGCLLLCFCSACVALARGVAGVVAAVAAEGVWLVLLLCTDCAVLTGQETSLLASLRSAAFAVVLLSHRISPAVALAQPLLLLSL